MTQDSNMWKRDIEASNTDAMEAALPSTGVLASVFQARIATMTPGDIARTYASGFLVRLPGATERTSTALDTDPIGTRTVESRPGDVFIHPLNSARDFPVTLTAGRTAGNDVWICDSTVSRLHARITISSDGNHIIEDANSSNGTRVHGMRLTPGQRLLLANRDLLALGTVAMLFVDHTLIAQLTVEVTSTSLSR